MFDVEDKGLQTLVRLVGVDCLEKLISCGRREKHLRIKESERNYYLVLGLNKKNCLISIDLSEMDFQVVLSPELARVGINPEILEVILTSRLSAYNLENKTQLVFEKKQSDKGEVIYCIG